MSGGRLFITAMKKNFTQIENDIYEELLKINLSGTALACAFYLLRKTNGWNKESDQISLSQFCKAVNRSRPSVCKALEQLRLVNIALLVKKGKSREASNEWAFNKNFIKWKLVNKPLLVKKKKRTSKQTVTRTSKQTVTHKRKSKEILQKKKKYTKEIEQIYEAYKEGVQENSRLTDLASKKIGKRLSVYSKDELLKAISNFAGDKWWMEKNASRGLAWFFKSDDRIEGFINMKGGRKKNFANEREADNLF